MSKQYLISEDVQKLLLVCQNLRQNLLDEKDKIEQMKSEVNSAAQRVAHAVKMSNADQEIIQKLKSEIGLFCWNSIFAPHHKNYLIF